MTHDGRLDEWIKELENKSFQNNTFDRRAIYTGRRENRRLSLGLAIAQSIGAFEVNAAPKFSKLSVHLGVASGDPLSDSVILWTRLALTR
ncbi:PhoD-like phosphatase N-terminal domain-containing protein [Bacillus amyloliquefaciens]|uniref:PhoD-like phosphatase N-terminal domain-containing protein n=1 Tax=Bacillus amyloliquefaciens TaxID=1390 RepID=UPI0013B05867